jgi:hypothetical protein
VLAYVGRIHNLKDLQDVGKVSKAKMLYLQSFPRKGVLLGYVRLYESSKNLKDLGSRGVGFGIVSSHGFRHLVPWGTSTFGILWPVQ